MIYFYHRFLPGIARTHHPLTDAQAGNPQVIKWSQELKDVFVKAKSALSSAGSLTHPSPSTEMPPTHMLVQLYSRKSQVVGIL